MCLNILIDKYIIYKGTSMRALEFINEEKIGVTPKRQGRTSDRPIRGHATEARYKEVDSVATEGIPSKKDCLSHKKLGASAESSCKARKLRARKTKKTALIGGKRVKLDGKKIASADYGGPLKDYS